VDLHDQHFFTQKHYIMSRFFGALVVLALLVFRFVASDDHSSTHTYQQYTPSSTSTFSDPVREYPHTYSNPYRYNTNTYHQQKLNDINASIRETQRKIDESWAKSFALPSSY
jgi:hypothetical protein